MDAVPERVPAPSLGVNEEVEIEMGAELTLLTLVPIGMSVVDMTVELAGQLSAPGAHEVTVVISVL